MSAKPSHLATSILFTGLLLTLPAALLAQPSQEQLLEETVTLGTRLGTGRLSLESPVPIDRIDAGDMQRTGGTETARILQSLAPSFNFPSSTISDGTDALRPATLRGLGPDQVLVLVNGKRRHTGALIHVNGSVGRGTAGVDLNAIPPSAIARIEILRDGAAAQYGSDAIAGVINIVLQDAPEGGEAGVSYGQYSEGDGETTTGWWHQGWSVGDGGFFHLALEYRERQRTNRARPDGSQWFPCMTRATGDGNCGTFDPREFTVERDVFRIGDAESEHLALVLNGALPLGSSELYGFATFAQRDNTSGGFYRRPGNTTSDRTRNPPIGAGGEAWAPLGFLPLIETDIEDFSIGAGLRGAAWEWDFDLSISYGENTFEFGVTNSVNASHANVFGKESPSSADAGTLGTELLVLNLDMSRPVSWGNLAWGAEWRRDGYEIEAGEELSWQDYDNSCYAAMTCLSNASSPTNASAGIQVFPGFRPGNEVDENRRAFSLYGDVEYAQVQDLLLTAAARYEKYSDFGDTATGKLAARWQILPSLAVRGALSSGFRAPSMQQLYFNNVSTQFVNDVPMEVGTFRNDSAVARAIGIPRLDEETSISYGLGLIYTPAEKLRITLDLYRIDIRDRIIISAQLEQQPDSNGVCGNALCTGLEQQGAASGQFFLNAADTETEGGDLVATWDLSRSEVSQLELSLAINYTNTRIDKVLVPSVLSASDITGDELFTARDQSILEDWQPKDRVNLTANWERGPLYATLGINRYGEYTVLDGTEQTFGAKYITDLQVGYRFAKGWHLEAGGNNIFDETPDTNRTSCDSDIAHGRSRASPCGGLVDDAGRVAADYPGVFVYSRRSAPFGFNGAYYYLRLRYTF